MPFRQKQKHFFRKKKGSKRKAVTTVIIKKRRRKPGRVMPMLGYIKPRWNKPNASGSLHPTVRYVWHKYVDYKVFNAGMGAFDTRDIVCNGIFDTDASIAGNQQPMWRDELALYYNNYEVVKSVLKCDFHSLEDTLIPRSVIGINAPNQTVASPPSIQHILQNKGFNWKLIAGHSSGGRQFQKLRATWYPKKTGDKEGSAENQASVDANPAAVAAWRIWTQSLDSSTNPGQIPTVIQVYYLVKYFNPKNIAVS